jgi:hypothetical protein
MAVEPHDGDQPQETDEPASNRGAFIALVVVAGLVLGGLWLMRVLGGAADIQDCVASGRTNCAPVGKSD